MSSKKKAGRGCLVTGTPNVVEDGAARSRASRTRTDNWSEDWTGADGGWEGSSEREVVGVVDQVRNMVQKRCGWRGNRMQRSGCFRTCCERFLRGLCQD